MFADACATARGFTRPVVISMRTVRGDTRASIGAFVVVNSEGWILTARHLIGLIERCERQKGGHREYEADVREMEQDTGSLRRHRREKTRHLKRPGDDSVRDYSVWWGADGSVIRDLHVEPAGDLAAGRLDPFAPASVPAYPVFMPPGPAYQPGRSLCRLGFPFHDIVPTFDEDKNAFLLPGGALPIPFFPIEGMFTRVVVAPSPDGPKGQPGKFIETSSPGLRGQSGGPIFDRHGFVWAIQSHTRHYPMAFRPQVPGRAKGQVEHQFLNAGAGVHVESILSFLEQHGVAHERAAEPAGGGDEASRRGNGNSAVL